MKSFISRIVVIFMCVLPLQLHCRYLSVSSSSTEAVEDTQHAVCKIMTQEIQATANATITRKLNGVCKSKDMDLKFEQLEKQVLHKLNNIESVISKIISDDQLLQVLAENKSNDKMNRVDSNVYETPTLKNHHSSKDKRTIQFEKSPVINAISDVELPQKIFQREEEIRKYNSTIQVLHQKKIFFYYWDLHDIGKVLDMTNSHMQSPYFWIFGHQSYIQFLPNHLGSNYVCIQLKSTDTTFKHRFAILNKKNSRNDLNSQVLSNTIVLYRISNDVLKKEAFISDDTLIIKLTVYS